MPSLAMDTAEEVVSSPLMGETASLDGRRHRPARRGGRGRREEFVNCASSPRGAAGECAWVRSGDSSTAAASRVAGFGDSTSASTTSAGSGSGAGATATAASLRGIAVIESPAAASALLEPSTTTTGGHSFTTSSVRHASSFCSSGGRTNESSTGRHTLGSGGPQQSRKCAFSSFSSFSSSAHKAGVALPLRADPVALRPLRRGCDVRAPPLCADSARTTNGGAGASEQDGVAGEIERSRCAPVAATVLDDTGGGARLSATAVRCLGLGEGREDAAFDGDGIDVTDSFRGRAAATAAYDDGDEGTASNAIAARGSSTAFDAAGAGAALGTGATAGRGGHGALETGTGAGEDRSKSLGGCARGETIVARDSALGTCEQLLTDSVRPSSAARGQVSTSSTSSSDGEPSTPADESELTEGTSGVLTLPSSAVSRMLSDALRRG